MELFDYQLNGVNKLRANYSAGLKRQVFVVMTGGGKTVVASAIIKSAVERGNRVLFLAHRKELINQCADKLRAFDLHDFNIIMAGSKQNNENAQIHIASIQTLVNRTMPEGIGLIIIDEAHRSVARSYKTALANYPNVRVLGLTATPIRMDLTPLSDLFDEIVEVCKPSELVEKGRLVKAKSYALPFDKSLLKNVKMSGGDYDERQLAKAFEGDAKLRGEIVTNWKRYAQGLQTIVFAISIEHAQQIVDKFKESDISAALVSGKTKKKERDSIISQWRDKEITVVVNVMVLSEGFDYPELECCILARPTASLGLYLQMCGRVLRSAKGKESAIILDHVGSIESFGDPLHDREWTIHESIRDRKVRAKFEFDRTDCLSCGYTYLPNPAFYLTESQLSSKALAIFELFKSNERRLKKERAAIYRDLKVVVPEGTKFEALSVDAFNAANDLKDDIDALTKELKFLEQKSIGLISCSSVSCGHTECVVCKTEIKDIKKITQKHEIEGVKLNSLQCPSCLANYESKLVIESANVGLGAKETNELLQPTNGDIPLQIKIKDKFNRLLNVAVANNYMRGWVFHELSKEFSIEQLKDTLPRHRKDWWQKRCGEMTGEFHGI